jgi:hypothetical protein
MQDDRSFWPLWAQFLQSKGLSSIAAAFLESTGPLTILLAQLVHAGNPFFGRALPIGQWQAIAALLEDPHESQSFAAFLREEDHR